MCYSTYIPPLVDSVADPVTVLNCIAYGPDLSGFLFSISKITLLSCSFTRYSVGLNPISTTKASAEIVQYAYTKKGTIIIHNRDSSLSYSKTDTRQRLERDVHCKHFPQLFNYCVIIDLNGDGDLLLIGLNDKLIHSISIVQCCRENNNIIV